MNANLQSRSEIATNDSLRATTRPAASRTRTIAGAVGGAIRAVWGWVPITWFGALAAPALGLGFYFYGMLRRDSVALPLTACGLFLVAAAVLVVLVTAMWLRIWAGRGRFETLRLEAGTPSRTGFNLGRVHWNPFVTISIAWETPGEVETRAVSCGTRLEEEVTAYGRAWRGEVVRRLTVTDVLGLARVTFRVRRSQSVRIMPKLGRIEELDVQAQFSDGDEIGHPQGKPVGDYVETRRYVAGDPLKMVLWKMYARTGQMLVRMPERAVSFSNKALAYLVAGTADEASAEIARAVLEMGRLGPAFRFGTDGSDEIVHSTPDALELVARSAHHRDDGGRGLEAFLQHGEAEGVQASLLFVPSQPGRWLTLVMETLPRFNGPFHAIVGADQSLLTTEGRVRRWILQRPSKTGSAAGMQMVVECLQAAGVRVSVIDPNSGRMTAV